MFPAKYRSTKVVNLMTCDDGALLQWTDDTLDIMFVIETGQE